jgi:hypothetical protein
MVRGEGVGQNLCALSHLTGRRLHTHTRRERERPRTTTDRLVVDVVADQLAAKPSTEAWEDHAAKDPAGCSSACAAARSRSPSS